jgi:hypothetical protein
VRSESGYVRSIRVRLALPCAASRGSVRLPRAPRAWLWKIMQVRLLPRA